MRRIPPRPTAPEPVLDKRTADRRQGNTRILIGTIIIIAVLHLARTVVVPVALAVLFAFLLTPIVIRLERTFLRRTGAIVLSLGLTTIALGFGGWWIYQQLNSVAKELSSAATSKNVDLKLESIRKRAGQFNLLERALQRVAGRAHLTVTTQAIGETSQRISRYLLTIALLNIGFGVLIGLGLWLLQVPHAALWGVLAGLLRFVPYIGAVLSAAAPTFLAFAVFPNWYSALAVLGLFIFSDQLIGGFIEPIVVGHRVGVSPIALLLAAIFWGWLWGPVGLLLATPIIVCLTVGGEFIPALRIFSIMFGSEDPLEGYLSFYNRLLLRDRTGAIAIADRYAESASMEEMFTDLFIPTLTFAQEELDRKRITQAHDHFIKDVVRELIIRFGDRNAGTPDPAKHIVAVSVAGERLSLGTLMLTQLLRSEGYTADYFTDLPEQELVAFINEVKPEAVFVSCANMSHLEQGHALLQLLSANFPDLAIIGGGSAFSRDRPRTIAAGATYVPSTLKEAKEDFLQRRKGVRRKSGRSMTMAG